MDTPDNKQQGGKPGSVTSSIQSAFKVMMNKHISWPWSPRLVYHVNPSDSVTLCTLGIGTAFGESVLDNSPHSATVVTNEYCELLRIEQRDFRSIWEHGGIFHLSPATRVSHQLTPF
ncbi:hypothetical protein HPB52_003240 [Rhipicephalus sanguineus]|uniref:Cyclic nucleotide-binding domain-containing protein n=1 Tax=Rhipicephalus sanguineus TaxID=34632 RepID=A0A9D4PYF7_RHISA|nr:hypothetical protein HPB52_003240 [Rhipicephalus sanguineus]